MTTYAMKSVEAALPGALVDYLFRLALRHPETDVQTFRLRPDELHADTLTAVEHTIYRSRFREQHRIFGFRPVCATVTVCFDGVGYNMSLADYKPLGGEVEVGLCCGLPYQTSTI